MPVNATAWIWTYPNIAYVTTPSKDGAARKKRNQEQVEPNRMHLYPWKHAFGQA